MVELIGCLCGKSTDIVKRATEGDGGDIEPMLDMLECAIACLSVLLLCLRPKCG